MDITRLLRLWLLGSLAAAVGALAWAFVPILIPLVLVAAGFGLVSWGAVAVARAVERRRR